MLKLKQKSIEFIYKNWKNDFSDDLFNIGNPAFEKIAAKAFYDLVCNYKKQSNKPFLIKLGGQSGSGKTTQLLPAIEESLKYNNINYIHIAVRSFAKYHPYFDDLLKEFGKENIREKTNGFALSLLFRVTEKLIENNYNILYEVTLLDPLYEEYLLRLAKQNNFKIFYHLLSIPLEISINWIQKRRLSSQTEGNRIVLSSSIDYFYKILPLAIEKIINCSNYFDNNDYLVIWNAYDINPLLFTTNFDNQVLNIFNKNREIIKQSDITEEKLLNSKKEFYKNNLFK